MAFFKRGSPHDDRPPEWAAFLTVTQWTEFSGLVDRELKKRSLPGQRRESSLSVMAPSGTSLTVSLAALARKLQAYGGDDWAGMVAKEFDIALAVDDRAGQLARLDDPWKALKIQLRSTDYLASQPSPDFTYKSWWTGTALYLAWDFPDFVRSVAAADFDALGSAPANPAAVALQNVWDQDQPEQHLIDTDSGRILMLTGGLFTSTFSMWPSRFLDVDPRRGVLIALPNRHTVFMYAVTDHRAADVPEVMLNKSLPIWAGDPGPISPSIFWTDGTDETPAPSLLEVTVKGQAAALKVPPHVLERLQPPT
jgi:hypothetical protein